MRRFLMILPTGVLAYGVGVQALAFSRMSQPLCESKLTERLKEYERSKPKKVLLLDGGLASELQNNGFDVDSDPLWSARLLHTNPKAIRDVHLAYLRAGSRVVTTASYQASMKGFKEHLGFSDLEALQLINRSVSIAREAIAEYLNELNSNHPPELWIAGSVGPYGACLHDGSEYSGSYIDTVTKHQLKEWHKPRIKALVEAGADVLAVETIPSMIEAKVVVDLLESDFPSSSR